MPAKSVKDATSTREPVACSGSSTLCNVSSPPKNATLTSPPRLTNASKLSRLRCTHVSGSLGSKSRKRQLRPQTVRVKTRRREKIKVLRGPMTELQRQAGSAVEDEIRWHSIQFRPQPQLGLWQDI